MERTYLRYECADSFGLTSHSGQIVHGNGGTFFTTGGSHINMYLNGGSKMVKIAHREPTNIGTGKALNSSEVASLDVVTTKTSEGRSNVQVASGWSDGYVRIFENVSNTPRDVSSVNSLLESREVNEYISEHSDPLSFNGHNGSTVKVVKFDTSGNRLASAGTNGDVVVWDVLAESGLYRLIGHRGEITSLNFFAMKDETQKSTGTFDGLVSSCRDGLVKIWDLSGQCCIQTLTGHRSEVWSADLVCIEERHSNSETDSENGFDKSTRWRLITGASDAQLRVWSLQNHSATSDLDSNQSEIASYIGSIKRENTSDRIETVKFHPNGTILGVLSHNSKNIEIYKIRSDSESKKKRSRRLRRRREKASLSEEKAKLKGKESKKIGILNDDVEEVNSNENDNDNNILSLLEEDLPVDIVKASDELELITILRSNHKIKGFSFATGASCRLLLSTAVNTVEVYSFKNPKDKDESVTAKLITNIDLDGHPTGIRSLALSSDDLLACSVGKGAAKVWNIASRSCIRSLSLKSGKKSTKSSLFALCCSFLPGNEYVVVGTRDGVLLLFDYASGDITFSEDEAHDGAIWSIDMRPDGSGMISGGADHIAKFWDFEQGENGKPELVHSRSLKMNDDVVAVRFSYSQDPSKRLVAVSTLDSTIKLFFDDSLKFFLSLYGHKLPALTLDCSDDDAILASAGADKTIKLWGLDFGDTHKTFYGHTDSITDLRFVRRTHNFFTTSKDKTLRYWDGDKFEQILLLSGHLSEVNCLAMSRTGGFILSAGMDRQVRVWERTKDIVFLEEEKERELEKMFDKVDGSRGEVRASNVDEENDEEADIQRPQSEAAVRKSVISVASGDRIAEAIETADQEMKDIAAYRKTGADIEKRRPNPLLIGLEPHLYVFWVLRTIKHSELEQSLLILPLSHIERLVYYLVVLLRKGLGTELCAKTAIFLVKSHENQIIANHSMASALRELRTLLKRRLMESRDRIGLNLAAMKAITRAANEKKSAFIINEAPTQNIWEGLGLGSDISAALQGRTNKRRKR